MLMSGLSADIVNLLFATWYILDEEGSKPETVGGLGWPVRVRSDVEHVIS